MESERLRFGEFEFERGELRRNGVSLRLPAQPSRLLALLVARAGQLVTREEIRREIWGKETYVDFEQGINFCIRQIRSALDDDAESPRFIQTVPKRGYRFLVQSEPSVQSQQSEPRRPGEVEPDSPARRGRAGLFRTVVVAGAAALAVGFLILTPPQSRHRFAGPWEAGERPMLVVLPFQTLDGGSDNNGGSDKNYLGLSFTEELITELGRRYSGRLGVIARTSAMSYAGSEPGIARLRRELHVDYVLEGTIRHGGDRLRVTARLIRAEDEVNLWTGGYNRESVDLLDLQQEVSEQIARALAVRILPEADRALPAAATSREAYDHYLQGRYHLRAYEPGSLDASIASFRKTIDLDPGFAPAYSGLAAALLRRFTPSHDTRPEAREAALEAVALDESQSEAHRLLADILFYYDLDPEGARREFERALESNPVSAEAHHDFAAYFSALGRHEEALAEVRKALALDPLSPAVNSDVGWYSYFARRYDDAIDASQRALALMPGDLWTRRCILLCELRRGNLPAAAEQARQEMSRAGAAEEWIRAVDQAPPREVIQAFWRWSVEAPASRGRERPPSYLALAHLALGDKETALSDLRSAYDLRWGWTVPFLRVDPSFDTLRGDPRFQDLLARIAWSSEGAERRR
jgi:TolB-like protein/DNA-binding winged helix-turn-helix (wHTH) protein/Tfp pilus assembly protein PilF